MLFVGYTSDLRTAVPLIVRNVLGNEQFWKRCPEKIGKTLISFYGIFV